MADHGDFLSQFLANQSGVAVSPGLTQTVGQEDITGDGPFGQPVLQQGRGIGKVAGPPTGVPAPPSPASSNVDGPINLTGEGPPPSITTEQLPNIGSAPIPGRNPRPDPAARVGGSSPLPPNLGQANQGVVGNPQPASTFAGPPNNQSPLLRIILELLQKQQGGENAFRGSSENLVSP